MGKRKKLAVSEIIGTILLLIISVTLFSVVYAAFFSIQVEPPSPSVNLVGTIDGNQLFLEHRGGKALSLDTEIIIDFNGNSRESLDVDESNFLPDENKDDGQWNIGERFTFPLSILSNFIRFDPVDIMVIDKESNSAVMMGTLKEAKTTDISIDVSVSDDEPVINDDITITITANNTNGPSDAEEVVIKDLLPGSLAYLDNTTSHGKYNYNTGIWKLGNLSVGSSATLEIIANVASYGSLTEYTQLALILDGSYSISDSAWTLMKNGLVSAIGNPNYFPHDGSIELTIIQFGVGAGGYCARVEVGPVVVNNVNYLDVVNQISAITQGKGYTPMAAGIYLAADVLASSNNFGGFNPDHKQVINLITDGEPNVESEAGELCGDKNDGYAAGRASAEDARYYLINTLQLSEDQDEFDVVAVDINDPDVIDWLANEIAWPQPGYTVWPPTGTGWVHEVYDWVEFANTIDEQFDILFNRIDNIAELISTKFMDPNSRNDMAIVSIYPKPV